MWETVCTGALCLRSESIWFGWLFFLFFGRGRNPNQVGRKRPPVNAGESPFHHPGTRAPTMPWRVEGTSRSADLLPSKHSWSDLLSLTPTFLSPSHEFHDQRLLFRGCRCLLYLAKHVIFFFPSSTILATLSRYCKMSCRVWALSLWAGSAN